MIEPEILETIFHFYHIETAAVKEDKRARYFFVRTLLQCRGSPHILPTVSMGPQERLSLVFFLETQNQKCSRVNRMIVFSINVAF